MRTAPYLFIGGTSEPGGLHVHTVDVAAAVAAAGHPVRLLCPSIDHYSAFCAPLGIPVSVIPSRPPRDPSIAYWRQHLAAFRGMRAVYCRGQLAEGPASELAGIRSMSSRLYTIEHRAMPDTERRTPAMLRLHGAAMRLLVRRCITVSDEASREARARLGLPARLVATCLNWVDPSFRPATVEQRREAKRQLGVDPDTFVIGYHGRLAPEKRVHVLIEALAALKAAERTPFSAVLVGEGWKRRELEALVAARGLSGTVRFTGWQADPSAAVRAFDCAVLPSLAEGFPLGLMESMASGSVCIAHPMSSTATLLRSGENGYLVDLQDPAVLAEALSRVLSSPPAERSRIAAAAATIERDYSRRRRLPDVLRALDIRDADRVVASMPDIRRNLVFAKATP